MTERLEPGRSTDRPGSDPSPDGSTIGSPAPAAHLVCAYSPRWLSGPSHYEGLVATVVVDADPIDPPADGIGDAP
jgi:hypothetical protein